MEYSDPLYNLPKQISKEYVKNLISNGHDYIIRRSDGSTCWYRGNVLHRSKGGPAVKLADGTKIYFRDGLLHSDHSNYAIRWYDNTKAWYKDGLPHRDNDRPAVEWASLGTKTFWYDGKLHRDGNNPAVITEEGYPMFYKYGVYKEHRVIR